MPRSTHVAFRNVPEAEPAWQYYGLDLPVVGGADTLADAQWVTRRDFAQWLRERVHDDPAMRTTFGGKLSSTGDFVVCAVLSEDSVAQALAQTSSHGTVHFAMPTDAGPVCWLAISGPDAEDLAPGARPLGELGVPDDAPVHELMQRAASCASEDSATRPLTLA